MNFTVVDEIATIWWSWLCQWMVDICYEEISPKLSFATYNAQLIWCCIIAQKLYAYLRTWSWEFLFGFQNELSKVTFDQFVCHWQIKPSCSSNHLLLIGKVKSSFIVMKQKIPPPAPHAMLLLVQTEPQLWIYCCQEACNHFSEETDPS